MSKTTPSSSKKRSTRDITITSEFLDSYSLFVNRNTRALFGYITNEINCPVPKEILREIVPKPIFKTEFERASQAFENLYNSDRRFFDSVPKFTIVYLITMVGMMGITCKDNSDRFLNILIDFIVNFNRSLSEELLDIVIPLTISKMLNDDPLRTKLIMTLVEKFDSSVFIPHLLKLFQSIMNDRTSINKLTRFHINLLIKIIQDYSIDMKDLQQVKRFTDYLLNETQSPTLRDVLKILKSTCDEFDTEQAPSFSAVSKGEYSFTRFSPAKSVASSRHSFMSGSSSFVAASPRSVHPEILEEYLDNADSGNYTSSTSILNEIRLQLERLKEFPNNRSFEKLFNLAMETYKSQYTSSDEKKQIFMLMTCINTICDPLRLLQLYLKNQRNYKFPSDFLEQCYQHFIKTSHIQDLISPSKKLPVSLVVQSELVPRKDIELAFTCLNSWETSYLGVKQVWEFIKNGKATDINEYFDPLDFTQKCFLVTGLKAYMIEEGLQQFEPLIEELDTRMMNETKSARVAREAQQVGEKMTELIKTETPKMNKYKSATSSRKSYKGTPSVSTNSRLSDANLSAKTSNSSLREEILRIPRSSFKKSYHHMDQNDSSFNISSRYPHSTTSNKIFNYSQGTKETTSPYLRIRDRHLATPTYSRRPNI